MSWLQTFLQPTQSYLVAFDIASSSQNYLNPNGLQRDRERLFEAIDQAKLVRRCASKSAVGGQFLGDEYRVAFHVNGDHGTIQHSDIIEFIDEVFHKLEDTERSMGYAPVVRALLTIGAVSASELYGFGFLKGGSPFDALSKLSQLVGKEINLLASNLDLGDGSGLKKETLNDGHVFLKRYTSRMVPEPYLGSPANNGCQHFFVISLTNTNHQTDDSLIDYAKTIVNRVKRAEDQPGDLNLTIGPSSVVFAIREASFSRSKVVLESIRQAAADYPYPIAAAIGAGSGQLVVGSDWVSSSFESGTAIELCRISSKLPPHTLAVPGQKYTPDEGTGPSIPPAHELLGPLVRNLTQRLELPGKRGEFFKASADPGYFPRHDRSSRSSADSNPTLGTSESGPPPSPPSAESNHATENRPNTPLAPSSSPPTTLKSRCRKHYEQGDQGNWEEILKEIESTIVRFQDKSRMERLLDTLTYFKADLNSLKSQAISGVMSGEEHRRNLAVLWRRALLFIDEIEASRSKEST